MADQKSFFLTNTSSVAKIEAIEMYHPSFGYFRFQYYDDDGITLRHENGLSYSYSYEEFEITRGNVTSDLDQGLSVTFADYKDTFKNAVNSANHMTAITLKYRTYRSDDLLSPLDTIQELRVIGVNYDGSGMVTFEASAEQLNNVKTGDSYTLANFPTLRGAV